MNPALETTDLETLFKIALTDDSIESRRRARLNVLQQSFDLEKAHDPQFLEFLGKTIKTPSARPDCPNLATGLPRCFNPRAREGATKMQKWITEGLEVSIHAPVKARPDPTSASIAAKPFQSTRP